MVAITSWGNLGHWQHTLRHLQDRTTLPHTLHLSPGHTGIAYGMGRSYGDVCLNPEGVLWVTRGLDHFIHFDAENGYLSCEAGLLLGDIQRIFIPKGWSLPVVPGTQYVTVGGAIANDVHGKNHHKVGSFGNHIRKLKILRTDGEMIECSPQIRADWFAATIGGLGLTGVIIEVEMQLLPVSSPYLQQETLTFQNVTEFFELADTSEANWEYTVAWLDCVTQHKGRGIFIRANPINAKSDALAPQKIRSVPFTPPFSCVNRYSVECLNRIYYHQKQNRVGLATVHYAPFFYPLDALLHWNRMYGRKGMYQYQCVLPHNTRQETLQTMLQEIANFKEGSFLAVLKTFGDPVSLGMLSFPQKGVTLALDFPNRGISTLKFFERLDAILLEAGGRIYLAKDARCPQKVFATGYPGIHNFAAYRDPKISSALSRRLMGD